MTKAQFEKLQREWYAKLKQEGFRDLETIRDQQTGHWSCEITPQREDERQRIIFDPHARQSVEDYYALAAKFLYEYQFETELDKVIWEYHSNGISIRNISRTLEKVNMPKRAVTQVQETVVRLRKAMKAMYLSGYTSKYET